MSIAVTIRLQFILVFEGVSKQFDYLSKTRWSDGFFLILSLVHMRKEHDFNSWVICVDLIKVFDLI